MAQEMTCTFCDATLRGGTRCSSCGAPTPEASEHEHMLWEMGQWDPGTAQVTSGSNGNGLSAAAGAIESPRPKPRHFSPVPMPKKKRSDVPAGPRAERTSTPPAARPTSTQTEQSPAPSRWLDPVLTATNGSSALAPEPVHVEEAPRPITPVIRRSRSGARTISAAPVDAPLDDLLAQPVEADPVAAAVLETSAPELPDLDEDSRKGKRRHRKFQKLLTALGPCEGELVLAAIDGTSGMKSATLLFTNFRVAIVPHSRRAPRWIPLEEVNMIRCRTGSSNVRIDAAVEVLTFGSRRAHMLQEVVAAIRVGVKEARAGGHNRHNAQIVQMWCDLTADVWDSPIGRLKLFVSKNPRVKLLALTPFAPVLYAVLNRVI